MARELERHAKLEALRQRTEELLRVSQEGKGREEGCCV